MKRITLPWAEYFRDLIDTEMSDKSIVKVFMKYAIKKENELNKSIKEQNKEDEKKRKKRDKEHRANLKLTEKTLFDLS